jgi:NAD(P) transhydrogenase subunit alpha
MSPIVISVTLFVLALMIGVAVIGKVPSTLHTPLMSGANSIHGVVLVGVIIVAAESNSLAGTIIIFLAALLGTLNVVGGYVVTDRMLEMFKPKKTVSENEADQSIEDAKEDFGGVAIEVQELVTAGASEVPPVEPVLKAVSKMDKSALDVEDNAKKENK